MNSLLGKTKGSAVLFGVIILVAIGLGILSSGVSVYAGSVVAWGSITDSSETTLRNLLMNGGTLTFVCDGVISLTSPLVIAKDTVLDGNGHRIIIRRSGYRSNSKRTASSIPALPARFPAKLFGYLRNPNYSLRSPRRGRRKSSSGFALVSVFGGQLVSALKLTLPSTVPEAKVKAGLVACKFPTNR